MHFYSHQKRFFREIFEYIFNDVRLAVNGALKVIKNHLIFKYNSPNIFGSATSFHEVVLQFIKNVLRSLNYLFTVVVGSVAVDVAAAVVVGGDSNLRLHHRLVDVAQVEGLW